MQRLPPLNALRAFEAAARHLSFTRAAQELSVTQAAVSHQIKALEERLGVRLFLRRNRTLVLTEEGQGYFPQVQRAFTLLRDATARVASEESKGVFTLSTLSSFAARWLVPRLGGFVARHPDIDLRLATSQHLTDFAREQVDAAIRYGSGNYAGLAATLLLTEELYPVCSPALLARAPLREPADLRNHTLLHDHGVEEWGQWLTAAGVSGVSIEQGHWYRDSSLLLQAAIAGQGVALGRSVLAAEEIAAGRLVRPFDWSLPSMNAYYFVCPQSSTHRAKVVAFREWLLEEVQRGNAPCDVEPMEPLDGRSGC